MMKQKEHIAGDYFPYLVEARDTFEQYLIESHHNLTDEKFSELINDINFKFFEDADFEEIYMLAEDLDKYQSLHTAEYDLEIDGSLPSKCFMGIIVIAIDKENSKKNLILDGNHRKNTLLKLCPKQKVLVIEVITTLP